ncbi:Na(+)/H(+) antiporter subunit B [Caldisericum sp. AR60]|uniref:Na(+)/H(+) antiporter subunit B n=1 Tax=Caldisericum sp. AR60 TaxID=3397852 RepID=UPI0039FD5AA4
MIRKIVYGVFILIIIAAIAIFMSNYKFGVDKMDVGKYYLDNTVPQTGAANVVTSVTLFYRGFDTLGEVTVLFTAALGVAVLYFMGEKKRKQKLQESNFVTKIGTRVVFPFSLLTGAYIFMHGHLTPGGGFQGGALIATGFLLLYLAYEETSIDRKKFYLVEGLGGLTYVIIGLLGFFMKGSFLANVLPNGTLFDLLSGGIMLPIYIGVGLKVGSELSNIIDDLMCEVKCEEAGGEE